MFEGLVHSANPSISLQYLGIDAATVPQARKETPSIQEEIDDIDPDRIITFGPLALMEVRKDSGKLILADERGRLQWADNRLLMPTMNPSAVWADPELFRDFARDVIKWSSMDEPINLPFPDYDLPKTPAELKKSLAKLSKHTALSLDVETTGFKPLEDRLLSIGIGTADGPVVIVPVELMDDEETKDILWEFLWGDSLNRIILQNAKFDLQFLAQWWNAFPDGTGARIADVMLLHYLLDERPIRSRYRAHGLKDQARTRYDVPDYHFDFEDFHSRLESDTLTEGDWDSLYRYHAMDCRITAMLWRDLVPEAVEESKALLLCHDNLLMPATTALSEAETRGILVDADYLRTEKVRLERRLERRTRALRKWVNDEEYMPGSPAQFVKIIKGMGVTEANWPGRISGGKASHRKTKTPTGVGEIKQLVAKFLNENRHTEARFLSSMLAWRQDNKNLSTYVDGILEHIGPDGRVHPSFNIGGTVTGRLSASGPNIQAIPRSGTMASVRRTFVAPEGWVLMEADYSQLELRTAAMMAKDPDLAKVYKDGRDLHLEVSSMLFRKEVYDISDEERFMAKALNFGILYGRSGWAISKGEEMTYAVEKLGMKRWTPQEGDEYVDRWMDGFPVLGQWLEEQKKRVLKTRIADTPFGRRRRFFITRTDNQTMSALMRQAVNTPIQSVASDVCLAAFNRLSDTMDRSKARLISIVHDSIWLEVREEFIDDIAAEVKELMEEPPFEWTAEVPLVVDIKYGTNLAEVTKWVAR